jgi:hypothetical protein
MIERSVVCPKCRFKYVFSSEQSTRMKEIVREFECRNCHEPIEVMWPSGLAWKINGA